LGTKKLSDLMLLCVMVCGCHGLWPSLLWPLLSTLSCSRHGHGLWPSWLWPSWSWCVAVMVCGRHGI